MSSVGHIGGAAGVRKPFGPASGRDALPEGKKLSPFSTSHFREEELCDEAKLNQDGVGCFSCMVY